MALQPTMNILLVGHVAHGKSTLTHALSSIRTGKFLSEKERNMTIRLGYANFKIYKCPKCPTPACYRPVPSATMDVQLPCPECTSSMTLVRHVSLVDSPGHHDLLTTMLSGASVTDAAILVVAADEPCPCPQTAQHLALAQKLGLARPSSLVCVQNKIDLCTKERCAESKKEIDAFIQKALSTTRAIPTIPISAQHGFNVDVLCRFICERFAEPKRAATAPALMKIVRSFDINSPGQHPADLSGGVVGGSLLRGSLNVGDEVEIRPGIVRRDGSFWPLRSKVLALFSEKSKLPQAHPGGLIGVSLDIDPTLTKGDRFVGQVLGAVGSLPPVFRTCHIEYTPLTVLTTNLTSDASKTIKVTGYKKTEEKKQQVVQETKTKTKSKDEDQDEDNDDDDEDDNNVQLVDSAENIALSFSKPPSPPQKGDLIQICIGSSKVAAKVLSVKKTSPLVSSKSATPPVSNKLYLEVKLAAPACAAIDEQLAVFSTENDRWRLAGVGSVLSVSRCDPVELGQSVTTRVLLSTAPATASASAEVKSSSTAKSVKAAAKRDAQQAQADAEESSDSDADDEETDTELKNPLLVLSEAREGWKEPAFAANAMNAPDTTLDTKQDDDKHEHEDLAHLPLYGRDAPEIGVPVFCVVNKIDNNVGVHAHLPEYPDYEGLIAPSELSKRRVLSLRQVAQEGQRLVCLVQAVDPKHRFIDLSRKKMVADDEKDALDWFHRSRFFLTVLKRVSLECKVPMATLIEHLAFPSYTKFGDRDLGVADGGHPLNIMHEYQSTHTVAQFAKKFKVYSEIASALVASLKRHLPPRPPCALQA